MPNLGSILKAEISRLSRRELRKPIQSVRHSSAAYRRDIAALKRQVAELQRQVALLNRQASKTARQTPAEEASSGKPLRFVAKGLRSLRTRLGISATELARLLGVSDQSVYNWEHKRSTPQKKQLVALAALRSLGKREVRRRLEEK